MTKIDSFYEVADKSNYYLGMISQVNRSYSTVQIENLSLFSYRKLRTDVLAPNTINYYVLIDSSNGLFFGEIFQTKVPNSDSVHEMLTNGLQEKIFPEISIDILGYIPLGEKYFKLNGTSTVGITDKVYIANEKVVELFVKSIEVNPDSEKQLSSFANLAFSSQEYPIKLQPKTLFNRHLMTVGTTNSGKSTSALSILDKLISDGIRTLIIDPTGEYSESFTGEEVDKYILGETAFLPLSQISMNQWSILFETNDGTQPAVLAEAIRSLRYQYKSNVDGVYKKVGRSVIDVEQELSTLSEEDKNFNIKFLSAQIAAETTKQDTRGNFVADTFNFNVNQYLIQKVNYKLDNTSLDNFFSSSGDSLIDIIKSFSEGATDKPLYIDVSEIGTTDGIGGMIVDLISNYLVNVNSKAIKPFVMFIDEVHRYTKGVNNEGFTFYTGLNSIAREGRKKGIFLFLTTQNPNDVDKVLLGQVGTMLIHRLTSPDELKAIQNHLSENQIGQIKKLNTGEAVLTSINLLKDLYIKVGKSNRVHYNETPSLVNKTASAERWVF
ncbi:ATP-binding protein [Streptococcus suis]|uniref:ATP-binding protein n=1 Tax=Streptococcus suis TaxID=1307 RepID=UPI001E6348AE|nr:ATP-binding protein [Streptococcus suis]MCB2930350.1 ATP-binding protein [Streptococcus suis]MCH1721118.1 ATP-binding protein [Streptococcus suis]MCK3908487.1 ATP-binding protein [Streptococcus suis]MCK3984891.1 ATP-binding protein [Streptococcus suis]MCL4913078.1 ATP-binding protein [Streptococcus suis]